MERLVAIWLLADRLADSKLRNKVMAAVVDVTNIFHRIGEEDQEEIQLFPPRMTGAIWSAPTKGKALRRYVVNYYVQNVSSETVEPRWAEFHPDFIKDLAVRSLESGPGGGEMGRVQLGPAPPECEWHDHNYVHDVCEEADRHVDETLFRYDD